MKAETVHSLVVAEVERSASEEGGSDQGDSVLERGKQQEEELSSKMEVDQDVDRCVCSSVCV